MVLVLGIAAGWLGGLVRSRITGQPYRVPELKKIWLVLAAVLPQLLIFQIPFTAKWFSSSWAAGVLVASQLVLLVFTWFNKDRVGIIETVLALYPEIPLSAWQIGFRPGRSKNILLPVEDTRLAWLSDSILLPEWFPWTRALSPGDLLIVLGVFWLLAVEAPKQSGLPEPDPGN